MRVKLDKKNGVRTFVFNGSIEKEIEFCKREITKKTEELKIWRPVAEKMNHEVTSREKRIDDCRDFIRLAEEELAKRKAKEESEAEED